jgi:hypothetical protein
MPYNLTVVFCLARKAKGGISFFFNLVVRHYLNSLRRFRQSCPMRQRLGNFAIHQSGSSVKRVEKCVFDSADISPVVDRVRPNPRDLPNVNLPICNNIASSRCEMPIHTSANSVYRLPHIDWNLIKVAKHVAANFVRQGPNSSPAEGEVDRHVLLGRDPLGRRACSERRLEKVRRDVPYNGDTDPVSADVIRVVVAFGKEILILQPH